MPSDKIKEGGEKAKECKFYGREKHALISVIPFRKKQLSAQDDYLEEVAQIDSTLWLKPMPSTFAREWERIKAEHNATYNNRGKNIAMECLQFGGNHEFWDDFPDDDEILAYFKRCYAFAINTIGYRQTDQNIVCAMIVTEPNRRNLFVYYLPITNSWQRKALSDQKSERGNILQLRDECNEPVYCDYRSEKRSLLCHTEFWKARGGKMSYSELQERFYNEISKRYGAKRGESHSRLKYTADAQKIRWGRVEGDRDDVLPKPKDFWV